MPVALLKYLSRCTEGRYSISERDHPKSNVASSVAARPRPRKKASMGERPDWTSTLCQPLLGPTVAGHGLPADSRRGNTLLPHPYSDALEARDRGLGSVEGLLGSRPLGTEARGRGQEASDPTMASQSWNTRYEAAFERPTPRSSRVKAGNRQRGPSGVIIQQPSTRKAGIRTTSTRSSCVTAAQTRQANRLLVGISDHTSRDQCAAQYAKGAAVGPTRAHAPVGECPV